MYERHSEPLLPRPKFYLRLFVHSLTGFGVIAISLGIGMLGYHGYENLGWLDALLNASMILGGMGPVNPVVTESGKVFASLYALFSGIVFLAVSGIIIAPIFHRILHYMHLEDEDQVQ